jgi:ribulose-phosphate 3-epimerase
MSICSISVLEFVMRVRVDDWCVYVPLVVQRGAAGAAAERFVRSDSFDSLYFDFPLFATSSESQKQINTEFRFLLVSRHRSGQRDRSIMFDHLDKSTWLSAAQKVPLKPIISPSLLACDFSRLGDESKDILAADGVAAEWLHVDVMDGHFVPNISIGSVVVSSLRKAVPHAFLDCHLMVAHPEQWVEDFAKAGASQFTFHIEATTVPKELIAAIRVAGMQVGIALKPKTPASAVFDLCDHDLVDMVLVMTVEPGFGGQSFMLDMMPKVKELRTRYPNLNIQVDGGLAPSTIAPAAEAGANVIVAGTSIFRAPSRKQAADEMRGCVAKALAAAAQSQSSNL